MASCAALLNDRAQADEFSGVVLIARNGIPLMERSYGYASKGYGIRNHVDTVFNIGSMTKMFTAVSIAQLAERGRLRFDDVVSRFLPEYPRQVGDRVTIHHLLTHTSGMGSFWNSSFDAARASLRSVSDYLRLFADDPLSFEPGARFGYSNAGYVVLGAIIERVSGMSYDDYVSEHLFQPAGMIDTGAWDLDVDVPNRAVGYVRDSAGDIKEHPAPRTNVLVAPAKGSPAGGSYSTVFDLLRFSQALQSHQLLSAESTQVLLQPRIRMGPGFGASYAYGFGRHDVGGVTVVGHNGGAPGIGAQLDMYLELGYTVAILSNYDAGVSMKVVPPIRQLLAGT
jgi:CubicO group peptidase (beta-lactamase class C family)